jgi:hypothetical protein
MTLEMPVIDRATMTHEQIQDIYKQYWDTRQSQNLSNLEFMKARIKQLGYTSMADFRRSNPRLIVTAGTITNYFRGYSTMSPNTVVELSYALRMTPNTFLSILGYYDPKKQTIVEIV